MPFEKGKVGNPEGAGNDAVRLSKAIHARFRADFNKHGIATIEKLRKKSPGEYLRIAVSLVPKQLHIDVKHDFSAVLQEASVLLEQRKERDITLLEHTPTDAITEQLHELTAAPEPVQRGGGDDD